MVMTLEEFKEKKKIYYEKNKERIKEYQKNRPNNYYKKHKDDPEFKQRKRDMAKKYYQKIKLNSKGKENENE
jgi:hypothetical protein